MPNLADISLGATITADTTPSTAAVYQPTNLITYLEYRTTHKDGNPLAYDYTTYAPVSKGNFESCYVADSNHD